MNDSNKSSLRTYLLYLLTLVTAITLAGAFSFYYFEEVLNPARRENNVKNVGDACWWAIVTLTTIGYGDISPVTPGGRITAVLLMFFGIGTLGVSTAGIAAYFVKNNQLELLRLRRIRDHVVICGLGDKGFLLARAFREKGHTVLVIEQNEANERVEACTEQGGIVLFGDATEPEMLARARIGDARYLIAVCGSDGANAEIAAQAREMVRDRKGGALTCSAHIVDPELWYLLRRWEIASVGAFRVQFFNVFDIGARALLTAHPPFTEANATPGHAPHLLVVGAGKLGQNLVIHAARLWRDLHPASGERLRVTLVDRETNRLRESLYLRHHGLEQTCEIETLSLDVQGPEFHQGHYLFDAQNRFTVTGVYICLDDDALGLSAALALLHRARRHHIPIVVRMTQDAGLAMLLRGARDGGRGFETIHAFGLLERACQPEMVLGGTNEALARAVHEKYLRDQGAAGQDAGPNPALVPWDELPEDLKEANRSQADHIGIKLQSIGCDIAPMTEWDGGEFTFTPEEGERMAEMEHARWCEEKRSDGWTLGPRDPDKKTNPNLVPWKDLPEDGKAWNRDLIRALPRSLARSGFQIYRLKPM